ncbi:MAG: hypothetical protein GXP55_21575 [Deltaproteobacteria bacterium]|nr:hypothetical protein [Deltaproteobacteria bacterium]
MHRTLSVMGGLVAALLWLTSSARAQPIEAIVAFVNDEPIFLSELMQRVAEHDSGTQAEAPREALEAMIDEALIRQAADRLSLFVSEEELSRSYALVRAQNGLDESRFIVVLRAQGIEPEQYRHQLGVQLLRMKVLQQRTPAIEIGEQELREMWRERVAGVPESERRPFAEAREALRRELTNRRAGEAEERAMRALHEAAYIVRRLGER